MIRIRVAVVLSAICFCGSAAAEETPWYGSLKSGYLFGGGDANLLGTTTSVYGGSPEFGLDDGVQMSFAIGRRLPKGWRIEAEMSFLHLGTDTGTEAGFDDRIDDEFSLDGKVRSSVVMMNALYDFNAGESRFKPYFKAGIGMALNEASAVMDVAFNSGIWDGTVLEGQSLTGNAFPEDAESSFSWNLGLGVRTALSDRFLLTLEYGFIDLGSAATGLDQTNDAIVYSDLTTQQLMMGLNFRF